ncbi:hypothetical protein TNCV_5120811 [Trichonephila clavipes]|nr:hypothetical protein TNCV_5120811 [Trichonephila clavipes]
METFRRCKQACVDELMMMPDHYPEEPFYVRALTELQDVEETMALAGAQINNLENTGPVTSGSNLASPREVTTNKGSNNSANQNAPQNQLPPPIMLFIEENYKVQMAVITKEFPKIRSRLTGDFLKLYTDSAEERRLVVQLLKRLKFQFYTIKAKAERPIKVVIKCLPRTSNPEEIKQDLEMLGYTPERSLKDRVPAILDLPFLAILTFSNDSDMAMENPTDMDLENNSLSSSRSSTPTMTNCERQQMVKQDLKKFSIMLSNVTHTIQCIAPFTLDDDPDLAALYSRQAYFDERRRQAIGEYSTLPRCNTPGCQVHSTPFNSPTKSKNDEFPELPKKTSSKQKESEDGFISPTSKKTVKRQ